MDTGEAMHDDSEGMSVTEDLVTKHRREHGKWIKQLSQRSGGIGPLWKKTGYEYSFFSSLCVLAEAPDCEFLIRGDVSPNLYLSDMMDSCVELELDYPIALLVDGMTDVLQPGDNMVVQYRRHTNTRESKLFISQPCIQREADTLTPQQLKGNATAVDQACISELLKWTSLGALKIRKRAGCPNIMDSRWVIRFKRMPDGSLILKARLCIRGFKDGKLELLDTFAGTASRYGQRAVRIIAATKQWVLWSLYVTQAFLKGLTFEEVSKMTGQPLRSVQLTLPKGAAALLQRIPGYESFDPVLHVLDMLRPGFGLKDAPRLWHLRCDAVKRELGTHARFRLAALCQVDADRQAVIRIVGACLHEARGRPQRRIQREGV